MISLAHFNHWKNEHADMPTQQENGVWFDMEDGLAYDPSANYGYSATPKRTTSQEKSRQISLNKAKESRKLAKFYGGKALTGTAPQKSWGEAVRNKVLESERLTDDQKEALLQVGGFTDAAAFWIENESVNAGEFVAENIVSQYTALAELERDLTSGKTSNSYALDMKRKAIADYINNCVFNFKTSIDSVQVMIDKERRQAKYKSWRK